MTVRGTRDGTRGGAGADGKRGGARARTALAALALTGAVGLAAVSCADPAPDRTDRVEVVHWNLCGAAHTCSNGGDAAAGSSVSRLVHETAARKPDVLSVNEVCRAQYDRLRHDLGAAGYVMHGAYAQMQRNVAACGDDTSFGTAVFSRQPLTGTPDYRRYSDTGGETYEGAGRTETVRRGLLCVDTTLADGDPLTACTSHAGTAFEQLDEVHRWFADPEKFPEDRPVVFAGDLNQQPNERSLSGIYAHTRGENDRRDPDGRFIEAAETDRKWFRLGASGGVRCDDPEAERCRNGPPTAADGRKIDYVFATESHFTDPHGSLSTYPESDHALYEGTFRLR